MLLIITNYFTSKIQIPVTHKKNPHFQQTKLRLFFLAIEMPLIDFSVVSQVCSHAHLLLICTVISNLDLFVVYTDIFTCLYLIFLLCFWDVLFWVTQGFHIVLFCVFPGGRFNQIALNALVAAEFLRWQVENAQKMYLRTIDW